MLAIQNGHACDRWTDIWTDGWTKQKYIPQKNYFFSGIKIRVIPIAIHKHQNLSSEYGIFKLVKTLNPDNNHIFVFGVQSVYANTLRNNTLHVNNSSSYVYRPWVQKSESLVDRDNTIYQPHHLFYNRK